MLPANIMQFSFSSPNMLYIVTKKSLELVSTEILTEEWKFEPYFISRISSTSNRQCLPIYSSYIFISAKSRNLQSILWKKSPKTQKQKSRQKNEIFNYYFYLGHVAHHIEAPGKHSVYSNFFPKIGRQ